MGESHVIIRSVYKKFNTKFQNISHNIFTYLTNVADYPTEYLPEVVEEVRRTIFHNVDLK